jgi:hypothetical protein
MNSKLATSKDAERLMKAEDLFASGFVLWYSLSIDRKTVEVLDVKHRIVSFFIIIDINL